MHLHDFGRVGLAQRAAVDGEVEGIDEHQAAVYLAVAAHHAVAGQVALVHAQVGAVVGDELVYFVERAFVKQHVDAFAGGHSAGCMLALDAFQSSAQGGLTVEFFKLVVSFFACHNHRKKSTPNPAPAPSRPPPKGRL